MQLSKEELTKLEEEYKTMEEKYGKTHRIMRRKFHEIDEETGKVCGRVDLEKDLLKGQAVCYGDGETYYFVIEEKLSS